MLKNRRNSKNRRDKARDIGEGLPIIPGSLSEQDIYNTTDKAYGTVQVFLRHLGSYMNYKHTTDASPFIQSTVAQVINDKKHELYQRFKKANPHSRVKFEDFLSGAGRNRQFRDMPINLGFMLSPKVDYGFGDGPQTIASKYPDLASVNTVGKAITWLEKEMLPGIIEMASGLHRKSGANISDIIAVADLSFRENVGNYNKFDHATGELTNSSEFQTYIFNKIFSDIKRFTRSEEEHEEQTGISLDLTASYGGSKSIVDLGGFDEKPVLGHPNTSINPNEIYQLGDNVFLSTPSTDSPSLSSRGEEIKALIESGALPTQMAYDIADVLENNLKVSFTGKFRHPETGEVTNFVFSGTGKPTRARQISSSVNWLRNAAAELRGDPGNYVFGISDENTENPTVYSTDLFIRPGGLFKSNGLVNPVYKSKAKGLIPLTLTWRDVNRMADLNDRLNAAANIDMSADHRKLYNGQKSIVSLLNNEVRSILGTMHGNLGLSGEEGTSTIDQFEDIVIGETEREYGRAADGRMTSHMVPRKSNSMSFDDDPDTALTDSELQIGLGGTYSPKRSTPQMEQQLYDEAVEKNIPHANTIAGRYGQQIVNLGPREARLVGNGKTSAMTIDEMMQSRAEFDAVGNYLKHRKANRLVETQETHRIGKAQARFGVDPSNPLGIPQLPDETSRRMGSAMANAMGGRLSARIMRADPTGGYEPRQFLIESGLSDIQSGSEDGQAVPEAGGNGAAQSPPPPPPPTTPDDPFDGSLFDDFSQDANTPSPARRRTTRQSRRMRDHFNERQYRHITDRVTPYREADAFYREQRQAFLDRFSGDSRMFDEWQRGLNFSERDGMTIDEVARQEYSNQLGAIFDMNYVGANSGNRRGEFFGSTGFDAQSREEIGTFLDETGRLRNSSEVRASRAAQMRNFALSPRYIASMIARYGIERYDNPVYGSGQAVIGASGEIEEQVIGRRGNVTISNDDVLRARSMATNVMQSAASGNLGSDPASAMANLHSKIGDLINTEIENYTKEMSKKGIDPEQVAASAGRMKSLVRSMTDRVYNDVAEMMEQGGEFVPRGTGSAAKIGQYQSIRLRTADQIAGAAETNPLIAQALAERGMTAEQAANLKYADRFYVVDQEGNASFQIGGGGGSGGRPGSYDRSGNLFGGPMGRFAYGAYVMKRMWGMTAQPFEQSAEKYMEYAANVSANAAIGGGATSWQAGFPSRISTNQNYMGRAAAEIFGGIGDIPYLFSGDGGTFGRMSTYAGAGGALAAAGMVSASMFGIEGLAVAGPAIGLATVGTGGILEALNATGLPQAYGRQFGYNDYKFTPTNAFRGLEMAGIGLASIARRQAGWNSGEIAQATSSEEAIYQAWSTLTPAEKAIMLDRGETDAEKRIRTIGSAMATKAGEIDDTGQAAIRILKAAGINEFDYEGLGLAARSSGIGLERLAKTGVSFAESSGYLPGTSGYLNAYTQYVNTASDPSARALLEYQQQKEASFGSQLSNYTTGSYGTGQRLAAALGLRNQVDTSKAMALLGSYSQFNGSVNFSQAAILGHISGANSPYVTGIIGQAMELGGMSGQNSLGIAASLSGIGTQQASVLGRALSGDMGALSFSAWQTGNPMFRFLDQSGMSVIQNNGWAAMQTVAQWAGRPEISGMGGIFSYGIGGLSERQIASNFLGNRNDRILDAFLRGDNRGGFYGLETLSRDSAFQHQMAGFQFQMAGIGLQAKGLQLNQQYNWGSGTWDKPSTNSAWGIEDQMRELSYSSSMASFEEQAQRLSLSKQYAQWNDTQNLQRMNLSQSYNLWQVDFNRNSSLMQRGWTQENWQYQDQSRALQYSWSMEDMDEAIRRSSGYERRQMLKQQDRATLSYNLDEEQIDKQRKQQETIWAQEDERYEKYKDYLLELQGLDKESFEYNKSYRDQLHKLDEQGLARKKGEYEQEKALQDQLQTLQRKHQNDQMELQKQQLGLQAAQVAEAQKQALEQKSISDAVREGTHNWELLVGKVGELEKYDKSFAFMAAMTTMAQAINRVDATKIAALSRMFGAANSSLLQQVNNGFGR